MKKLILLLIVSTNLYANEIVDPADGKNIAAQIKDVQMEEMLKETGAFKECRDLNKDPKNPNIQATQECFQKKLAGNTNSKQLEDWSNSLNLQGYGLVKSKNIRDIQKYLNDKLYKALTGVDPEEEARKNMLVSFKDKKHIDQKVFIEMYKNQLGKNALYEVSRFCFEDLRHKSGSAQAGNFFDYWNPFVISDKIPLSLDDVTDDGKPKFGTDLDPTKKDEVYQKIFTSIQGSETNNIEKFPLSNFFTGCGRIMLELCNDFQTKASAISTTDLKTKTKGSTACLTKDRIQKYRSALAAADKLVKYFDEKMVSDPKTLALAARAMSGQPIKLYGQGGNGEESIDDLTNSTSRDFLLGGASKSGDQDADNCLKSSDIAACDKFITDDESFEKATNNINTEMTLKREIEVARVKAMKDKDLKQYLEDNGYLDILNDPKFNDLTPDQIAKMIGEAYDAKRVALIQGLNAKMGSRQASKSADKNTKVAAAQTAITETKEERARLAQVVLFNNIITSHLELQKRNSDGTLETAGRNVNAWKKEEQALGKENIDSSLFSNLKQGADGVKGIGNDNQIDGFEILDTFLGKPEDAKKTK